MKTHIDAENQNPYVDELIKQNYTVRINSTKLNDRDYQKFWTKTQVSQKIREAIRDHQNQLFIGLGIARVYDDDPNIDYCQECSKQNHHTADCMRTMRCKFCGSRGHDSKTCKYKIAKDYPTPTHPNCRRKDVYWKDHSSSWSGCPSTIREARGLGNFLPNRYSRHPRFFQH